MFEKEFPNFRKIAYSIMSKYTENHRIINCIEECSELQKALTKLLRYDLIEHTFTLDLRKKVIEEIADVYITIEEVKYILNIRDEQIYEIMEEKINRGVR